MSELSVATDLALQIAVVEAKQARQPLVAPEHLLIGVCSLGKLADPGAGGSPAAHATVVAEWSTLSQVFAAAHLDPTLLRRALRQGLGAGAGPAGDGPPASPAAQAAYRRAFELANGATSVEAVHLLAALLESPGTVLTAALSQQGVEVASLRQQVAARLAGPPAPPASASAVERFGRDLTRLAGDGKLPPVIGRREEMLAVIQVLQQLDKPNAVLIGEPGVGKTAVVEGIAQRIAAGKNLPGRRIIALDLASVLAGSAHRGEFEERLTRLIDEVKAHPEIILFIDELHQIVGAGAGGGPDAANILKPALARGDLRCIGATTIAEYRRYVESDAALERRFQPILVDEPTPDEAREMLEGLKERYERGHGVTIDPDALTAAVDLSVRYLPDRRLPDKAKDILDTACSWVTTPSLSAEDLRAAASSDDRVTRELVVRVVARRTGIPAVDVLKPDAALLRLEEALGRRIVGQDDAIQRVARRIRINQAGLGNPNRPIGVFLFLGPTGVGKTELAKGLAAELFHSPSGLIRIDMSEYQEKHEVSKLIGAPPGYVGYGQEGQLTGKLRTHPYSVVLLDEVEKAHPEIFDLFLQVFDDGRLTDATGRTIDARHALFIMTSNLVPTGTPRRLGFDHAERPAPDPDYQLSRVRQHFRPEFLNRIDDIIVFQPLGEEQIAEIVRRQVASLSERLLRERQLALDVTDEAVVCLVRQGYDPSLGARELNRVIDALLIAPLADRLLAGEVQPGDHLMVRADGDRLSFQVQIETA